MNERATILHPETQQDGAERCSPGLLGLGQCERTGMNRRGLGEADEMVQHLPGETHPLCKEHEVAQTSNAALPGAPATHSPKECEGSLDLTTPKEESEGCSGALNTALEELAKISEDLCKFQEEIRKRSNHRRMKSDSCLQEMANVNVPSGERMIHSDQSFLPVCGEKEKEPNRKNLRPVDTLRPQGSPGPACGSETAARQRRETPPLPPPRSTSRNFPSASGGWSCGPRIPGGHGVAPVCLNEGQRLNSCVAFPVAPEAKAGKEPPYHGNVARTVWPCGLETGSRQSPLSWFPESSSAPSKLKGGGGTPQPSVQLHPDLHLNNGASAAVMENTGPWRTRSPAFERTMRNERLAVKTDEFNRTVFRTDRSRPAVEPGPNCAGSADELNPCDPFITHTGHDPAHGIKAAVLKTCAHMPASRENVPHHIAPHSTRGPVRQGQEQANPSGSWNLAQEYDWRPSSLSARPRSADPRSNYGAVERLLETPESSTGPAMHNSERSWEDWTECSYGLSGAATSGQHLEMPQLGQEPLCGTPAALGPQQVIQGRARKASREESVTVRSSQGFSRPALPANRRLPSRWALRSPSASPALLGAAPRYSFSAI